MILIELEGALGSEFINPEHVSAVVDMGEGVTQVFLACGKSEMIFGEVSDVLGRLFPDQTTQ